MLEIRSVIWEVINAGLPSLDILFACEEPACVKAIAKKCHAVNEWLKIVVICLELRFSDIMAEYRFIE